MTCDAQSILDAGKCFDCIPSGLLPAVQTYLLAVIAGGSLDPKVLMAQAAAFQALDGFQAEVQTYLLCQIVNK